MCLTWGISQVCFVHGDLPRLNYLQLLHSSIDVSLNPPKPTRTAQVLHHSAPQCSASTLCHKKNKKTLYGHEPLISLTGCLRPVSTSVKGEIFHVYLNMKLMCPRVLYVLIYTDHQTIE